MSAVDELRRRLEAVNAAGTTAGLRLFEHAGEFVLLDGETDVVARIQPGPDALGKLQDEVAYWERQAAEAADDDCVVDNLPFDEPDDERAQAGESASEYRDSSPLLRRVIAAIRSEVGRLCEEEDLVESIRPALDFFEPAGSVRLDDESRGYVETWLLNMRPLAGSCRCGDVSFERGRLVIHRLAVQPEPRVTLEDAADALTYMQSVAPEPVEYETDDERRAGAQAILSVIEDRVRQAAANLGPPAAN